jgi:hypothetical protein
MTVKGGEELKNRTVSMEDGILSVNVLSVNAENRGLVEHPERLAYWQHRKGFWSSADPGHPFFHAVGHEEYIKEIVTRLRAAGFRPPLYPDDVALHRESTARHYRNHVETEPLEQHINFPLTDAVLVLEQVGRHALTSYPDLIAEVYAGLLAGREFSPEIREIYRRMGGPDRDAPEGDGGGQK